MIDLLFKIARRVVYSQRESGRDQKEINTALKAGNQRLAKLLAGHLKYFSKADQNGDGELSYGESYGIIKAIE